MDTVLLATDGSDDDRTAARQAVDLARQEGADLDVLCVVDRRKYNEPAYSSDELVTIQTEDRGQAYIEAVTALAADAGVEVAGEVCHGVPHETILEHADAVDADLIVVGEHESHARHVGGIRRRAPREADRNVVVVPSRR